MAIIAFKEKDGTVNMAVAGNVSRDPVLQTTDKGSKVKFSVGYGKGKFQNVEAKADTPQGRLAGCLEKGDRVLVFGKWETWTYQDKSYDTLYADFISAQQDASFSEAVNTPAEPKAAQSAENSPYSDLQDTDEELPF